MLTKSSIEAAGWRWSIGRALTLPEDGRQLNIMVGTRPDLAYAVGTLAGC